MTEQSEAPTPTTATGDVGGTETLTEALINLPDGRARKFFFRAHSAGDTGVLKQIFGSTDDYNVSAFARFPDLRAYLDQRSQAGQRPLIIDAGANIGASPLFFVATYPGCRVIALEPEHRNVTIMRRNCEGLDVIACQAAVGCERGVGYLNDPGCGDWGFRVGTQGAYPVPILPMAEILADPLCSGHYPLLCKIDIEGGEASLFSKNNEWLDAFPLIIIELHDSLFPGEANSRNFLRAITDRNFDFLYRGENVFCFNNALLGRRAG